MNDDRIEQLDEAIVEAGKDKELAIQNGDYELVTRIELLIRIYEHLKQNIERQREESQREEK
jgi:hypothetical protein